MVYEKYESSSATLSVLSGLSGASDLPWGHSPSSKIPGSAYLPTSPKWLNL